jgi:hypothetical protein
MMLRLLKEKEEMMMPARGDYDTGRWDSDHYPRPPVGPIVVRVGTAIVRIKHMPVVVAVMSVVNDVISVMVMVVVGIRRRG